MRLTPVAMHPPAFLETRPQGLFDQYVGGRGQLGIPQTPGRDPLHPFARKEGYPVTSQVSIASELVVAQFQRDFLDNLRAVRGVDLDTASPIDCYQALAATV